MTLIPLLPSTMHIKVAKSKVAYAIMFSLLMIKFPFLFCLADDTGYTGFKVPFTGVRKGEWALATLSLSCLCFMHIFTTPLATHTLMTINTH